MYTVKLLFKGDETLKRFSFSGTISECQEWYEKYVEYLSNEEFSSYKTGEISIKEDGCDEPAVFLKIDISSLTTWFKNQ